jgi:hypothetical protein
MPSIVRLFFLTELLREKSEEPVCISIKLVNGDFLELESGRTGEDGNVFVESSKGAVMPRY